MAKNKAVYEGDTIKLFCDKAEGFVYALRYFLQSSKKAIFFVACSSQYSCVTTAPQSASLNVHCKFISINYNIINLILLLQMYLFRFGLRIMMSSKL